jgi:renalase
MKRVIVVGAGLAGITAARLLRARGHRVTVIEKSRGFGGRLATRRVEGGRIDHGAPFFTVRDASFREAFAPLVERKQLVPWVDRLHRWDGAALVADPLTAAERRWAAPEGMASLVRAWAGDLDVRLGMTVNNLSAQSGRWQLQAEASDQAVVTEEADVVVIAIPGPQARVLVKTAIDAVDRVIRDELERVRFDPCLVVLAGIAPPTAPIPWRGIASTAEPLQWIGLESAKRESTEALVTVHATGDWSREHWQLGDTEVVTRLLEAASRAGGAFLAQPRWSEVKRWRYAKPVLLANGRALLSETAGPPLVFCGDWCMAPRVEGAFLSGTAAAERLIYAGHL